MLKLMKLELRKHKLGWYWMSAIIADLIVMLLTWFIPYVDQQESGEIFQLDEILSVISVLVRVIYIIMAAVLISKFIIDEYRNKTISTLFTYPVPRKKLMAAKMILIMLVTFVTMLVSHVFITTIYLLLNSVFHNVSGAVTSDLLITQARSLIIQSLSAVGMAMIPLYFGMLRKSSSATIISAILVALVINNTYNGSDALSSIIAIPITIGAIGLLVAYLSIRNIEKVDIP